MKRLALIGALAASMLLATACNPGGGGGGGGGTHIAVIRLDDVVKAQGWDKDLETKLTQLDGEYQRQLREMVDTIRTAVEAKEKEWASPTKEQQETLGRVQYLEQVGENGVPRGF